MDEKVKNLFWVLPAIALLGVFTIYPLGFLLVMSFTNSTLVKVSLNFVGLSNFLQFLRDPVAVTSVINTLIFDLGGALLTIGIAFVVGLFLNLDFPYNNVVRALILMPWMFSLVDVSLEWKWMLDPAVGLYNWLLKSVGLINEGISWTGYPNLAMFTVIFVMAWYLSPFMALLVTASLYGVPNELYEAARLDGASKLARFRYITWHSLRYPILIGYLLTAAWFGNNLDVVFVMTGGGPANATMILPYYMFTNVFYYLNLSYGSTIALINFVILGTIAGTLLYVFRRYWRAE